MQTLDELGLQHGTDKASNRHDYLKRYAAYFAPLREQPINLLEIGVQFGNSIKMWADYFPNGQIYGLDLVRDFETDNPRVHLVQGDAGNGDFWDEHNFAGTAWDIVIDDGAHTPESQTTAMRPLWPAVKPGGWYVLEDFFTMFDPYFARHQDGPAWAGTLLEVLNGGGLNYHGRPKPPAREQVWEDNSIEFIHCYPGLVILNKRLTFEPRTL